MNLLTTKIKSIKKELTNLKTSHARGLGNVKIYHRIVQVDPSGHDSGTWFLNITATFDRQYAAYPLVQIIPAMLTDGTYTMEPTGIDYSDSGFTLNAQMIWWYEPGTNSFTIESTAPVDQVNYTWSR